MTGKEDFNELFKKKPEFSVDVVLEMAELLKQRAELLKQRTADINSKDYLFEEEHKRLVASQISLTNKTQECSGLEIALISKRRLLAKIRDGLEYNDVGLAQGVLKISGEIFNERIAKASRD
jgi:hypothetical protein